MTISVPLRSVPWQLNAEGQPRRCGVEIEMNGLTLDQASQLVADQLGLQRVRDGRYEHRLTGDPAGDWIVELDFDLLKKMGRRQYETDTLSGELGESAEELLKTLALPLVPLEVVSPPLPLDRLTEVEQLIARLREAGARGTSDTLTNAFGMQLNPEIPSRDPHQITAVLKAFLCLYDWLFKRARIDLMRRVTLFAEPFPKAYVLKVIDTDYWPSQERLIEDYLNDNPTRNRALDLLPLFRFLDEDQVLAATDDVLIKARPTWHYRLPNCEIHVPDWGLYQAWNDWVEVERLAADTERLEACCRAFRQCMSHPLDHWFGDWVVQVERNWISSQEI
ncbi:hypothetical protein ADINL_0271 [Nitrincola lacisaponensis]|uniref:Amidoligase enzyme n=1 Tax=Nitrincola lacisaponensis TaxID=267850 RepID=A0A063Y4D2_9GAMM|nr:amidoligase family protein [Nitrincola lacisaponensis]KDE41198.1 hypothetical protein ADINL_0271 [Nitrincola lacisaponensis]